MTGRNMGNRTGIQVHIDRLVLDGLPVQNHEGPAVKKAFQAELGRLLAEGNLSAELTGGGAFREMPGGSMTIGQRDPRKIGREIARVVYGGIGR